MPDPKLTTTSDSDQQVEPIVVEGKPAGYLHAQWAAGGKPESTDGTLDVNGLAIAEYLGTERIGSHAQIDSLVPGVLLQPTGTTMNAHKPTDAEWTAYVAQNPVQPPTGQLQVERLDER